MAAPYSLCEIREKLALASKAISECSDVVRANGMTTHFQQLFQLYEKFKAEAHKSVESLSAFFEFLVRCCHCKKKKKNQPPYLCCKLIYLLILLFLSFATVCSRRCLMAFIFPLLISLLHLRLLN
jgi:hypothetical protein